VVKEFQIESMKGGWFVGDFIPSALQSQAFEVGVKRYPAGEVNPLHVHKRTTEITVVIEGSVIMNQREYGPGTIVVIEPNEPSDFKALTDSILVVVKTPSLPDDKFSVPE